MQAAEYSAFVEGLRFGLGVTGAMSKTVIDTNKYSGEIAVAQELGIRLPQTLKAKGRLEGSALNDMFRTEYIDKHNGDYRLLLHGVRIGLQN